LYNPGRRRYPHNGSGFTPRWFERRAWFPALRVHEPEERPVSHPSAGAQAPPIAGDRALAVAQADAQKAYGDLAPYRIELVLEADGWHVDYEFKNPRQKGGGPHYVIDSVTGEIRSKRYEQ
jgi:hypothetical protein